MSSDLDKTTDAQSQPGLKEPHLLDLASLLEVAQWIALAVAGGIVGNTAYDLVKSQVLDIIKNVKRRSGSSRVQELEEKVLVLVEEQRGKTDVDADALKQRVSELFGEFH